MNAVWRGLSSRERVLVSVAALVTVAALVWQMVIGPTLAASSAAQARHDAAVRDLSNLDEALAARRIARISQSATGSADMLDPEQFKTGVSLAASQKGLAISRMQSGQGGELGLVFDRADPRLLFIFLEDVETRLGGNVERMTLEQAGGGSVRATFEFSVRNQ